MSLAWGSVWQQLIRIRIRHNPSPDPDPDTRQRSRDRTTIPATARRRLAAILALGALRQGVVALRGGQRV